MAGQVGTGGKRRQREAITSKGGVVARFCGVQYAHLRNISREGLQHSFEDSGHGHNLQDGKLEKVGGEDVRHRGGRGAREICVANHRTRCG